MRDNDNFPYPERLVGRAKVARSSPAASSGAKSPSWRVEGEEPARATPDFPKAFTASPLRGGDERARTNPYKNGQSRTSAIKGGKSNRNESHEAEISLSSPEIAMAQGQNMSRDENERERAKVSGKSRGQGCYLGFGGASLYTRHHRACLPALLCPHILSLSYYRTFSPLSGVLPATHARTPRRGALRTSEAAAEGRPAPRLRRERNAAQNERAGHREMSQAQFSMNGRVG